MDTQDYTKQNSVLVSNFIQIYNNKSPKHCETLCKLITSKLDPLIKKKQSINLSKISSTLGGTQWNAVRLVDISFSQAKDCL